MNDLLSITEASRWASNHLNKNVTASNISYLIQYGRIQRVVENGSTYVYKNELIDYYKNSYTGKREIDWKSKLGEDLNWHLSFDYLKEADTTKHVHRLHPYKGKFIPQLVEYFLNDKTDEFKKKSYFKKGDIVLDPFCGSGTTLVQANEMGMHAVGIDVSAFNALISNVKVQKNDFILLYKTLKDITLRLKQYISEKNNIAFEDHLLNELNKFNNKHFPSPEFKYKVRQGLIDEKTYGHETAALFEPVFYKLQEQYNIKILQDSQAESFLDKWFLHPIRQEVSFVFEQVEQITDHRIKRIASIILSRTVRSCRATTHADLATLKEPVSSTYYCRKHGKVCKPLFSMLSWWERYCDDTVKRLAIFDKLRTDTHQTCLIGDSRSIDIVSSLSEKNKALAELVSKQRIKGVFSSPPYVGLIDYHEQHAYAYDLFGFERQDELEIGPLYKGRGKKARDSYVNGISEVLRNCKKFLTDDYDVFLVANDKQGLYPVIAEQAEMQIVNSYKRPVLNRTEKDKGAYSESIFHLKQK